MNGSSCFSVVTKMGNSNSSPPVNVYTDGAVPRNGQPGARGGIGVNWGPRNPK